MPFFSMRSNLSSITQLHLRLYRFMVTETIPIAARIQIEHIKKKSASSGFGPPDYTPDYAAKRQAQGLQTSMVDFRTHNGRLLDVSLRKTNTGVGVEESAEPIIEGLSGRRPSFWEVDNLLLSDIEVELAVRIDNAK